MREPHLIIYDNAGSPSAFLITGPDALFCSHSNRLLHVDLLVEMCQPETRGHSRPSLCYTCTARGCDIPLCVSEPRQTWVHATTCVLKAKSQQGRHIETLLINPSSPHDALKHIFTSLKSHLIFLQLRVLLWQFPWNWFTNTWHFSLIFHPLKIIFIHYKSRIATAIRGL